MTQNAFALDMVERSVLSRRVTPKAAAIGTGGGIRSGFSEPQSPIWLGRLATDVL